VKHALLIGLGIFAVLGSGCTPYGDRTLHWDEAVTLASGEIVHIKRTQRIRTELNAGGPSGNLALNAKLQSAEDPPAFPAWEAPMLPILLDRDPDTSEWILIATMSMCEFWNRNQEPEPPYWAFRARHGRWYRTDVPPSYWNRPANLFAALMARDTGRSIEQSYRSRLKVQTGYLGRAPNGGVAQRISIRCSRGTDKQGNTRERDLDIFGRE
jgi:hypothetical protein